MPVSVVRVDNHRLIRDGVKAIFDRGSEYGAVGKSENSAEAVQLCRKSRPDTVLMDIGLLARPLAAILDLGFETIGSYRKTMTKKLGVNDAADLTQLALAAGLAHGDKRDANFLG